MDFFAFDDEYVRRLRDGHRETVEHYFKYFNDLLKAKLRRRGLSRSDIEDIIQTTHFRVFDQLRRGDGIRDGHAFGGWVNTICTHVAQEHERKRHETVELDDELPSHDEGSLRELITKETNRRVRFALLSLAKENPRDADILCDLYFRDLDKDEICRNYGVDRNYLRVLLHRALKKFRDEYDPDDS